MQLSNKLLAILITMFCVGIVITSLFLFELKLKNAEIAETFFDLNALTEAEEEQLPKLNSRLASTNTAFDEDEAFKDVMRNFKTINTDTPETEKNTDEKEDTESNSEESLIESPEIVKLSETDKQQFEALNEVVKSLKNSAKKQVNANSALTYSLKDRKILSYKTPRYLCEAAGTIVVNITVNSKGIVTDSYINRTSTSKNQCLIEHALEYANNAKFNSANITSQIGSITFYFEGKN